MLFIGVHVLLLLLLLCLLLGLAGRLLSLSRIQAALAVDLRQTVLMPASQTPTRTHRKKKRYKRRVRGETWRVPDLHAHKGRSYCMVCVYGVVCINWSRARISEAFTVGRRARAVIVSARSVVITNALSTGEVATIAPGQNTPGQKVILVHTVVYRYLDILPDDLSLSPNCEKRVFLTRTKMPVAPVV